MTSLACGGRGGGSTRPAPSALGAHGHSHLASQFKPQGFEDRHPLRGHRVGGITRHFTGKVASSVSQFLQQDAP
jgi:hypothetical protein